MVQVDETTQGVLNQISEGFEQKGAYNLRQNGIPLCHGDSEHIKIRKKEDKPGIDILIDGETKGEKVFIPVVVSVSGMTDLVYNDFYVADGADVTIVAGCGIHKRRLQRQSARWYPYVPCRKKCQRALRRKTLWRGKRNGTADSESGDKY